MDDRKWDRWLALTGIVFVVLMMIAGFLPGSPPKPSDSAAKIARFAVDKGDELRWSAFVGSLVAVVFLVWVGVVWKLMRRAEGGVPRLAVGAALSAAFAVALFTVGGVIMSVVAIVGVPNVGAQGTRFCYLLYNNLNAAGTVGLAVFFGAFSIVIIETGVLPRVMGWLGTLIALLLLAAGVGVASTRDIIFVFGFIGYITASLWIIVVSVMMFRAAGAGSAAPTVSTS